MTSTPSDSTSARSDVSELLAVERCRFERGRGKRTDRVERLVIDDLSSLVRLAARHRDAQLCDDVRALPRQRLHELPAGVETAGGASGHDGHGLAIQITRADEPVERVLRDSGEAAGVLGRRHDHDIGLGDTASPLGHRRDGLVLAGEVERGDVGERIELFDSRAVLDGDRSYDIECSAVRGATLEASADEQHTNHDSPNPARAAGHSIRAWEPRHSGRTHRQARP